MINKWFMGRASVTKDKVKKIMIDSDAEKVMFTHKSWHFGEKL